MDEFAKKLVSDREFGLDEYYRTSSLLGCNVKNVFDDIIFKVLQKRQGIKAEVEKDADDRKGEKENKLMDRLETAEKKKCVLF